MRLSFTGLPETYAIARLPAEAPLPDWASGSGLTSITRATDELSILCPADRVPDEIEASGGWSALRVDMLAGLDEPGVVLAAVQPISQAGFGVFVISTHLRDYLLVRRSDLPEIVACLEQAGHTLHPPQ